jgi:BirA family transcriptional regulator, biotin operon repressor / biotin---[acetyl-CoA-carboxylase] ligase
MVVDITSSPADEVSPLVARVFTALADGQFHSGEELATNLSVTRSAIWKAARALRALGATVHAVRNRGYRLARASEPLDAQRIRDLLSPAIRERIKRVEAAWQVGSTNTLLMGRPNPKPGTGEAMLAEYQTAGRGRRGRTWLAPPGGSICLSMSWTFREIPRNLGALSLAIGVCALRALKTLPGLTQSQQGGPLPTPPNNTLRLKWPNDLLVEDRKLGGILIELRAESEGPACVVIGIGLNVSLGAALLKKIAETGLAPVDLMTAGLRDPARNTIAAALISAFVQGLLDFEREGLKAFIQEWQNVDAFHGRLVNVHDSQGAASGIARGIDLEGALLVETPTGLRRFISGDVSVRADS